MNAGPERFVLAIALVVPLGIAALSVAQLPGASIGGRPSFMLGADPAPTLSLRRAAPSSQQAPAPTLVPPTPTPRPTVAPTVRPTPQPTQPPAQPTQPPAPTAVPTPQTAREETAAKRTYVVQRGDQLKHIAAAYGVNIWSIIAANDIPNPDSLRVGQVLTIPDR